MLAIELPTQIVHILLRVDDGLTNLLGNVAPRCAFLVGVLIGIVAWVRQAAAVAI